MNPQRIGERLSKLRGKRELKVVAEAVGISISALSMYESGERIPRDDVKIALADYYKTTVQSLFFT
ncbi:MAG: helix-turn-helix transcriptional regulator [Clostridia bacterium]|nr:helix-turn-helix transcriptional regulator [Clostridia bacterium]